MTLVAEFLKRVQSTYATGQATEHSYRPDLKRLLDGLRTDVIAINEPKRVKVGAPDFLLQRDDIAVGHVEAKDVGVGLRGMKDKNKEQQDRYRAGLPNLVYTNCLDWDFYRKGERVASVTIADHVPGLPPRRDQFPVLEALLKDFAAQQPQTITTSEELATIMAGKAGLIKEILKNALAADEDLQGDLAAQYIAFREHLIHDITAEDFADIYAETLAYGMFAARLHDESPDTFSRQEALTLLPKSNPFLRSLFGYVAGPDLDEGIAWIVDELAQVLRAADLDRVMADFGKLSGRNDPFLHFYETFLAAYNPKKRKARGVWYTPEAAVNFIVRAVDDVLKVDFKLADGLADTSKARVTWDTGQTDRKGRPITIKKDVHRVQVLDPATGTGTFLAEVIKQIAPTVRTTASGAWSKYVEQDLIPRVHGFELLMASYAMCHLKLDMVLTELGYKPTSAPPRLSVYLTNSLEEGEPANQTLPFAQWLSNEVKQANTIKRDMPIMCVVGNPPYSGISQNRGDWISSLIESYKYVDGKHFGERKHWLQDDYVKFLRLAEYLVTKNGHGVVAYICNHGFLGNPTFRGMRWHLMRSFDTIQVIDLHGNANKAERTPDGGPDANVFDIRQGVCIVIAVRRQGERKGLARVQRHDLWGARAAKYATLQSASRSSIPWTEVTPFAPYYMFYPVDRATLERYDAGFKLTDMFRHGSVAAVTGRDAINVSFTPDEVRRKLHLLRTLPEDEARRYFGLGDEDARDWRLETARADAQANGGDENIVPIAYRPFDLRWTCYTGQSRGLYASPQQNVMRHLLAGENVALCFNRSVEGGRPFTDVFVFKSLLQHHSLSIKEVNYVAPLRLFGRGDGLDLEVGSNLEPKLAKRLQKAAKAPGRALATDLDVFDYIYGVLHCPAYRETYVEFLSIDFPRIPWPSSAAEFWDVAERGGQLRRLHLLEPEAVGETPYPFQGEGDGTVEAVRFKDGKVWINASQHFADVSAVAWDFPVGGYQPARKWLSDRKGRTLSFEDVRHYQRIIKVLVETNRIMGSITMVLSGGEVEAASVVEA